ncbi:MAG: ABC transporter permease [Actinobacteria bacterium]|nr:ABC transporter permease [Actinomycetota bacterium]
MNRVPWARRNLLAEPRRLVAGVAGVGLALMLILLIDGLWAGMRARVTVYEDSAGADLFVAQPGTRNFLGAVSVVPIESVNTVAADPDVKWAAPVRGLFSILDLHGRKVPAYLIGSEPGREGGPWDLASGRLPRSNEEAVVGAVLARRHHLAVGDPVTILGREFRIVGTAGGADTYMTSFVFVTHAATDQLLRAPGTTSYVITRTDRPDAVRARLAAQGFAVLDIDELRENDLALSTRAFEAPIRIILAVAFLAGSTVIGLTTYTSIAERRREYGIVKAMGAGWRRLTFVALGQTMMLALGGVVAGAAFFVAGRALIAWTRPQFAVVLTPTTALRAVGAALLMGIVAATVPARRLARLDPATAYRGG